MSAHYLGGVVVTLVKVSDLNPKDHKFKVTN